MLFWFNWYENNDRVKILGLILIILLISKKISDRLVLNSEAENSSSSIFVHNVHNVNKVKFSKDTKQWLEFIFKCK